MPTALISAKQSRVDWGPNSEELGTFEHLDYNSEALVIDLDV